MDDWEGSVTAFAEAAGWYVATTAEVGDRWDEPGLGEWDVRALVGHTSRSLVTVEAYLAQPPEQVDLDSTVAYYLATREIAAGPGVAERGVAAGEALGEDPAAAVAALAARVVPLVEACHGSEEVTTIAGGMRLRDYLPTRTFELVVHTCDLARALGTTARPPATAAAHAMGVVTGIAVADGRAADLLLAATGRVALPPGFSVM